MKSEFEGKPSQKEASGFEGSEPSLDRRAGRWEPVVGEVIPDAECQEALARAIPKLEQALTGIVPQDLEELEKWLAEYTRDLPAERRQSIPPGFWAYQTLRANLSAEEIGQLARARDSGSLAELVQERISRERETIAVILQKQETRENLSRAVNGMQALFRRLDRPLPRESLPPVQFFGKYETAVLSSTELERLSFFATGGAIYLSERDALARFVTDDELEQQSLAEESYHAYVHENFHSFPEHGAERPAPGMGLTSGVSRIIQGFATFNPGNPRRFEMSFDAADEGATELFARLASREAGFSIRSSLYQSYVEDMAALAVALAGGDIPPERDPESFRTLGVAELNMLLDYYLPVAGTFRLMRRMEAGIGRYAAILFDYLSRQPEGFRAFLRALESGEAGSRAATVRIPVGELQERYGANEAGIARRYPFIVFDQPAV